MCVCVCVRVRVCVCVRVCVAWKPFDPEKTGYREQVQMLRILRELGHRVVVIDADDLMDNSGNFCASVWLLDYFAWTSK